jgi:hypothetical protein
MEVCTQATKVYYKLNATEKARGRVKPKDPLLSMVALK